MRRTVRRTLYEGFDINSLSLATACCSMRNIEGRRTDFPGEDSQSGTFFTGHPGKGHCILFGFARRSEPGVMPWSCAARPDGSGAERRV